MNSDVPRPEKVLQQVADENVRQDLSSAAALPTSYYQLLLQKCRSRRGTSAIAGNADMAASDPKQRWDLRRPVYFQCDQPTAARV